MQRQRVPRASGRTGAILAAVLVGLFVASLLGLGLVRLMLMHHRQGQVAAWRQQCFWLAESGLQRAAARLAKSPEYGGETWTVPGQVLGASRPGLVTIRVTKAAAPSTQRVIRVEARFPDDPLRGAVIEREHTVRLPSPGASS